MAVSPRPCYLLYLAGLSVLLERLIPGGLLGAPIIALFLGTIINSFFHPTWIRPALKFTSKKILKVAGVLKDGSKLLMVTALAAIGLGTSLLDFKKAGLRPMFYGITIDTLVTVTALVVIWCMGWR